MHKLLVYTFDSKIFSKGNQPHSNSYISFPFEMAVKIPKDNLKLNIWGWL